MASDTRTARDWFTCLTSRETDRSMGPRWYRANAAATCRLEVLNGWRAKMNEVAADDRSSRAYCRITGCAPGVYWSNCLLGASIKFVAATTSTSVWSINAN